MSWAGSRSSFSVRDKVGRTIWYLMKEGEEGKKGEEDEEDEEDEEEHQGA